jgi:drug/metabolite transporter superfamily protein YnfA
MMPDNWGFVFAAYGLALVVLVLYWRFLVRRERELTEGRQIAERGTGLSTPRAGHPTA